MNKDDLKVIFIDLDGTLLDKREDISDENRKALMDYKEKGYEIIISTGRPAWFVFELFDLDFPFKYLITQNGAQIWDQNRKKIFSETLNEDIARFIIKEAMKKKLIMKINQKMDFYSKGFISWLVLTFYKENLRKFPYSKLDNYDQYDKILLLTPWKWKARKFKKIILNKYTDGDLSICFSGGGYAIECTGPRGRKGVAALFVLDKLGYNPSNALHIGDSMNDKDAFDVVGYSIAMKNSERDLLKVAKTIGPSYKNAGVAKILNNLDDYIKN